MNRFIINGREKAVVSFDEYVIEKRQPLVAEVNGRIAFREGISKREVASFPVSHFESAHATLSWIVVLCCKDWFTIRHLRLFLKLLGVGLPTVEGICDPSRPACTLLDEPKPKGGSA